MKYRLSTGDCLDVLKGIPDNFYTGTVCDPPYGLEFMNQAWDHGVPGVRYWEEIKRVNAPGAMLLAFGGTRTHHRLMVAIENAGWEIRDCLMWLYGSGFPHFQNISKAIDKSKGAKGKVVGQKKQNGAKFKLTEQIIDNGGFNDPARDSYDITAPATPEAKLWEGYATALKPAWEPIIVAMKPREGSYANNALEYGVAGFNIDGCRIEASDYEGFAKNWDREKITDIRGGNYGRGIPGGVKNTIEAPSGRYPANLILDSVAGEMLGVESRYFLEAGYTDLDYRFFYIPKASKKEREFGLEVRGTRKVNDGRETPIDNPYQRGETQRKNTHPTVKPIKLMRYLVRLIKMPEYTSILDPFVGSGTTGMACAYEGIDYFEGIDISSESIEIASLRIQAVLNEPRQLQMVL